LPNRVLWDGFLVSLCSPSSQLSHSFFFLLSPFFLRSLEGRGLFATISRPTRPLCLQRGSFLFSPLFPTFITRSSLSFPWACWSPGFFCSRTRLSTERAMACWLFYGVWRLCFLHPALFVDSVRFFDLRRPRLLSRTIPQPPALGSSFHEPFFCFLLLPSPTVAGVRTIPIFFSPLLISSFVPPSSS